MGRITAPRRTRWWGIALGVCLPVIVSLSGCGPLSRAELQRQIGGVEAVSSEGALLAHQVALERSKDTFVRVHADELASQMDHTSAKLSETREENEVPSELQRPASRTIRLAQDASGALQSLELNPSQASLAQNLERKLDQTANAASSLASKL
jgi:hypothetical protein